MKKTLVFGDIHGGLKALVQLLERIETAIKVGGRRGAPQILTVRSGAMHQDGFKFYLSENNVWLTDKVPAKYIAFKPLPSIKKK